MRKPPTRAELIAAVQSHDPTMPLARRVAVAIHKYVCEFDTASKRAAGFPDPLVLSHPADEVEAFALEQFAQQLAAAGITVQFKAGR